MSTTDLATPAAGPAGEASAIAVQAARPAAADASAAAGASAATGPAAPPVTGAAALEGDLGRFGAAEVLHWLRWAQATGRAEFRRAAETIALVLEAGRLVEARSDGRSVRTGDVLVHRHQVTPQMLAVALSAQREQGGRIGERLIEDGAAEPGCVRQAVEECARRVVYRLLLWREGRFRFVPGARWSGGSLPVEMDLEQLVLDGLRVSDALPAAG